MKVEQIYNIVNELTSQYLGKTEMVNADLSNIIDIGSETINLDNLDKYVNSLIDQIGKITFVNRPYEGLVPSLYRESWRYGAIRQKISYDELPDAEENETWKLQDGQSYDQDVFTAPKVSSTFFSKKVTFDIPMSFAKRQVETAFQNATQLNSFFTMIETAISNSMTLKMDSLAMSVLTNMIGKTITTNTTAPLVINVAEGSFSPSSTITGLELGRWLQSQDQVRKAIYKIMTWKKRLTRLSKMFNISGSDRFTPYTRIGFVLNDAFAQAAKTFLYSNTYNEEFVHLEGFDSIPYWQTPGTKYDYNDILSFNINIKGVDTPIKDKYVIGVMFDEYAVGISNLDRRTTSHYNGRAEFFNNWYKFDAGYYNDTSENFIVFTIDKE